MSRVQRLFIDGRVCQAGEERFQVALRNAHAADVRPLCLCQPEGVPMYVALHTRYLVKRMPQSGHRHHPQCPSYEPAPSDSGLGHLLGQAVVERQGHGVDLHTAFAWESRAGRPQSVWARPCSTGARREQGRMSLQALVHFLFERAGFHRWSPAMAGKRSQAVLRKYLLQAAQDVRVPGGALHERLYVPEPYDEGNRPAQAERRRASLSVCTARGGRRPLALVIGELKRWVPIASGELVWIRHMPELPLRAEARVWRRVEQLYAPLLQVQPTCEGQGPRRVLAALVRQESLLEIEHASLMLASSEWIPLEGLHELPLLRALIQQERYFLKPLTYDATPHAFANFVLLDAGPQPVPLHVISRAMTLAETQRKHSAMRGDRRVAWLWDTCEPLPQLPDRVAERRLPHAPVWAARAGRRPSDT